MDTQILKFCADCFGRLTGPLPCPHCGWAGTDRHNGNALSEFTQLQSGRYTLGRILGVGGFGITYVAFDNQMETVVAIKEYMPAALAERHECDVVSLPGRSSDFKDGFSRFNTEWQILSSLSNIKSIVRALDFFRENSTAYIVMERLTGADIKTMLSEVPPQEVVPFCEVVIRNIGAALIEVHNRGIVHLDVSPANIFFQLDGSFRLIDFGSAMFIRSASQDTVQLKHGYAPPEMYSMSSPKGAWTDVYALAATYYNLTSGLKVPSAETRLKRDELTPLESIRPEIPRYISDSISRALALNPDARYRTVLEFLSDFGNAMPVVAPVGPESQDERIIPRFQPPERNGGLKSNLQKLFSSPPKFSFSKQPPPNLRAEAQEHLPAVIASSGRFGTFKISLSPGVTYKLGRLAGAGYSDFVVTDDLRVSKVHLSIRYDLPSETFIVTDISSNGTFFPDGRKLNRGVEYTFYLNDSVCLGSNECIISLTLDKKVIRV